MSKLKHNIISLVFPARCLSCELELESPSQRRNKATDDSYDENSKFDFLATFDSHWCRPCFRKLTSDTTKETCRKCGASFVGRSPYVDRCQICFDLHLRFDQTIAIGNYRGRLQELVIRMKNQKDEQLATQLGYVLGSQIRQADFLEDIDLIVPVPTYWFKRFRRGFCGAEVTADAVGKACDLSVETNVLQSLKATQKQGTLSTPGRFKNVRNVFGTKPNADIDGKTILIIDDVMTSGATCSEVTRALRRAGASKVYVGVIARGARVS